MAGNKSLLMPWKQWIRSLTLKQLSKNVRYVKPECTLPKIAPAPAHGGKTIIQSLTTGLTNIQHPNASAAFCF